MVSLKLHRQRWQAKVRIPKALEASYGGKQYLYRHLPTSDRRTAKVEADAWEAMLRMEWSAKLGHVAPSTGSLRAFYEQLRREAESGELTAVVEGMDPVEAGIDLAIDRLADAVGERDLTDRESARLAALQDAIATVRGQTVSPRRELEPTFRELADDYITIWKTKPGRKDSNTEQQKQATFNLFAGYWGARPIRDVRKRDASLFVDALRQLDPLWARSPKAKAMSWSELQRAYGGRPQGLSDATINRHTATLQSLWTWAYERDYCEGYNPFSGFHTRLTEGKNVSGYQQWDDHEIAKLFDPPPKRNELTELMLVAMFTGMRLDEIASLTWADLRTEQGVTYFNVEDAKTPAGNRRVPLHPRLDWLKERSKSKQTGRIWPQFNPEGPGKKPGADAGKEFSRHKQARGFTDRRKVFHSFRNNVVGQLEEAGVPVTEIAQLVGHEKPFTLKKYNKRGLSLRRLSEIVELIAYLALVLPEPSALELPTA